MHLRSSESLEHKQRVLARYRKLGVEWGFFVGALLGVIGGGIQMHRWENPVTGWGICIAVLTAIGGLAGYLFYDLIFGAQIRAAVDAGWGGDLGGAAGGDGGGGD